MNRGNYTLQHSEASMERDEKIRFPNLSKSQTQANGSISQRNNQNNSQTFEPIEENENHRRSTIRDHRSSSNLSNDLGIQLESEKNQNRQNEAKITHATSKVVYMSSRFNRTQKKVQSCHEELMTVYLKKKRIQDDQDEKERRRKERELFLEMRNTQKELMKTTSRHNLDVSQRNLYDNRLRMVEQTREQSEKMKAQRDEFQKTHYNSNRAKGDQVRDLEEQAQQNINQYHDDRYQQTRNEYERKISLERQKAEWKGQQLQALEQIQEKLNTEQESADDQQLEIIRAIKDMAHMNSKQIEKKYSHLIQSSLERVKRNKTIECPWKSNKIRELANSIDTSSQASNSHVTSPKNHFSSTTKRGNGSIYSSGSNSQHFQKSSSKSQVVSPNQTVDEIREERTPPRRDREGQNQQGESSSQSNMRLDNEDITIPSKRNYDDLIESRPSQKKEPERCSFPTITSKKKSDNNITPLIFFSSIDGQSSARQRQLLASPYLNSAKNSIVKFLKSFEKEKLSSNRGNNHYSSKKHHAYYDSRNTSPNEVTLDSSFQKSPKATNGGSTRDGYYLQEGQKKKPEKNRTRSLQHSTVLEPLSASKNSSFVKN